MDKDLTDAVLAAFDGKGDGEKPEDEPAAAEDAVADADAAPTATGKAAALKKKPALAAASPLRRAPMAAAAVRKPVPPRDAAEEPALTATPKAPSAAVHAATAVPVARTAVGGGMGLLILNAVLVVLVVVLVVVVFGLKSAVARQEAAIKELRNLARITVSVYQEPGKRAQQVIAAHDIDAKGSVKIGRMIIQPLPEE